MQDFKTHMDDYIEQDLIPFDTGTLVGNKVLVFAPHPDDETLGCGGSLIQHQNSGDNIRIIFLTDGGKGDFNKLHEVETYINKREQEAKDACNIIGVSNIEFWRIGDRQLGHDDHDFTRILNEIDRYKPTLVYVTSPIELNPDHRAAARMIWQAIKKIGSETSIAFYELSTPFQPNLLIDITSEVPKKKKAASCYVSQMYPINYVELVIAVNRFRSLTITGKSEYAEAFILIHHSRIMNMNWKKLFPLKPFESILENEPTVSIIIRTKDRPVLLNEAITSVVDQDYSSIEVIVVNDGGEDVRDLVQSFKEKVNIKYLLHEQTQGRSSAANSGLDIAKGKYIGFLDDDDILSPSHVGLLVRNIEENESVGLVYSDCYIGHYKVENDRAILISKRKIFKGQNFDRDRLYQSNYIPIMTALFRKSLLQKAGNFDLSFEVFEDWDFWIRLSMHTDFRRIDKATCEYRIFGSRSYDYLSGQIQIYNKYWQICTPRKLMEWLHKTQGENDILREKIQDLTDGNIK